MPRLDDPKLSGDLLLYRRIPHWGGRALWDDPNNPVCTSQNFRDKDNELSVYIANECSPERALEGHDGFGLIQMLAHDFRDICKAAVILCRHEEETDKGHVVVCGKITGGMASKLSKKAVWVDGRWPTRIDPFTNNPMTA